MKIFKSSVLLSIYFAFLVFIFKKLPIFGPSRMIYSYFKMPMKPFEILVSKFNHFINIPSKLIFLLIIILPVFLTVFGKVSEVRIEKNEGNQHKTNA